MKSPVSVRQLVAAAGALGFTGAQASASLPTSIFSPTSTPARELRDLSVFVLAITGTIFVGVSCLLMYVLVRYRTRPDDQTEPPQVFGSVQIELAWTIIPILILVVLFLSTARVLFSVQDAREPASALEVTVVGHQFWWEFRYPQYNVVTANELHVPLSSDAAPRPTFMKLTSADVMHSFWVPRLAGKTDLLPNRVNEMWIDPHTPGLYVGQCAQFCGAEHAKMLLRVYVDAPQEFQRWISEQQKPQTEIQSSPQGNPGSEVHTKPANGAGPKLMSSDFSGTRNGGEGAEAETTRGVTSQEGQLEFEHVACINCHTVAGTVANGRFGPDLTHLMSRSTLAAGAISNTPEHLNAWISDPDQIKPGSLMPDMHLSSRQNALITAYLLTLK